MGGNPVQDHAAERHARERVRTVWWDGGAVCLLDQTRLPHDVEVRVCRGWEEVADAIRRLQVRGAPAIGAAAAYAMALAAAQPEGGRGLSTLRTAAAGLEQTRPTAVNLRWALARMLAAAERAAEDPRLPEILLAEADAIAAEDARTNRAIAALGAAVIRSDERILTYCNTGSLATVEGGTAYGILREAHRQGKRIHVYACETRPLLQGARLTAWELSRDGIPATLITDNAAASIMARGGIDRVIVGADRVARNGDVANKIGTYALALLARAHGIPFMVAAPLSTVDRSASSGAEIPIEERAGDEVTEIGGRRVAAEGVEVYNPAFDVTPHDLIAAIITEAGIAEPPLLRALAKLAATPLSV